MEKAVSEKVMCKKNSEKDLNLVIQTIFGFAYTIVAPIEPKYFGMSLNRNFGVYRN